MAKNSIQKPTLRIGTTYLPTIVVLLHYDYSFSLSKAKTFLLLISYYQTWLLLITLLHTNRAYLLKFLTCVLYSTS